MTLEEVLAQAVALSTVSEAGRLVELAGRLSRRRLRILVAGEAKRGKSTLVNALLGRALLPTGVTPLTAVTTTVSTAAAGEAEHAVVTVASGGSRRISVDELPMVVTETGNPGNAAGVESVTVHVHNRLLDRHPVDLVDTPGIGSVYAHNTSAAHRAITTLDAAVLVLSVDPPATAAEQDLLREVDQLSVRTFVLLNKSDRLSREELGEALAFTEKVCSATVGRPVTVLACSARAAAADPGFAAFTAHLSDYLLEHAERDIDEAGVRHLARALAGMRDSRMVRVRMLELAAAGQQHRLDELAARLTAIGQRRGDIADRCAGSLARLRQTLDRSAAAAVAPITRACRHDLEQHGDSELGAAADVEDRAREKVSEFIADAVDRWRTEQTRSLEIALGAVIKRTEEDVAVQAQLARDAIQDVLDITVGGELGFPHLEVDPSFRYDFTRPEGWAPPLHGWASRVGSASHRRNRAQRRVMEEVASLTDRQLGRARADLQRRLEQTGRVIRRALDDYLADATEAFGGMLTMASFGLQGGGEGGNDEASLLRAEAAQLGDLMGRLDLRPPG